MQTVQQTARHTDEKKYTQEQSSCRGSWIQTHTDTPTYTHKELIDHSTTHGIGVMTTRVLLRKVEPIMTQYNVDVHIQPGVGVRR